MPRSVTTRLWAWSALGLVGSLLIALAAPRALSDHVVGWWYAVRLPVGQSLAVGLVWVGMALLAVAWVGLARDRADPADPADPRDAIRGSALTRRRATLIAVLWVLPLTLAPPLFSRDVYSYLAQGTILHLGHDPYHQTPTLLAALGHAHVLAAVSTSWRHTTAPYGPLFLELVSLIVALCGQHLIAGVLLLRVLDLVGLGLLAIAVPRIARATGADGARGVWLVTASPLAVLTLVAAGHNDILMVGLLATGVAAALRGRPLLGIAVCALAATIKVPALVGAVFIAVAWARSEPDAAARARLLAAAAALGVGVIAGVTLACGVGLGWLSSSVFSTPAHAHLVLTPAIAISRTIAGILGDVGAGVSVRGLETTCVAIATVLVAVAGAVLLFRVRVVTLVGSLGVCLILAAVGGPAAWPWYLAWGVILLCGARATQRSGVLQAVLVLGAFFVAPDGTVVVPPGYAPIVVVAYGILGVAAVVARRSRRQAAAGDEPPAAGTGTAGGPLLSACSAHS